VTRFEFDHHQVGVGIFVLESPKIVFTDDTKTVIMARDAESAEYFAAQGILNDGAGLPVGAILRYMILEADKDRVAPLNNGIGLRILVGALGKNGETVRQLRGRSSWWWGSHHARGWERTKQDCSNYQPTEQIRVGRDFQHARLLLMSVGENSGREGISLK
jgi:hypothetical protein